MIKMNCPACDKPLQIPDEFAGQTGTCNGCHSAITVPVRTKRRWLRWTVGILILVAMLATATVYATMVLFSVAVPDLSPVKADATSEVPADASTFPQFARILEHEGFQFVKSEDFQKLGITITTYRYAFEDTYNEANIINGIGKNEVVSLSFEVHGNWKSKHQSEAAAPGVRAAYAAFPTCKPDYMRAIKSASKIPSGERNEGYATIANGWRVNWTQFLTHLPDDTIYPIELTSFLKLESTPSAAPTTPTNHIPEGVSYPYDLACAYTGKELAVTDPMPMEFAHLFDAILEKYPNCTPMQIAEAASNITSYSPARPDADLRQSLIWLQDWKATNPVNIKKDSRSGLSTVTTASGETAVVDRYGRVVTTAKAEPPTLTEATQAIIQGIITDYANLHPGHPVPQPIQVNFHGQ